MNWNKKLLKNLNYYIPLAVFILVVIGFIAISSAVEVNKSGSEGMVFLRKQIISFILGIMVIIAIQFFDYSIFKDYSDIIYLTTLGILGIILVAGQKVAGGTRWIRFGPVNFQPSEVAKIMLILVLAAILDENRDLLKYLSGFIKPFIYAIIPFVLIILQNDLGTSLVLLTIFIGMLFVGGGNLKFLGLIFGGGGGLILMMVGSHLLLGTPLFFLKEYQLNRLIVFISPGIDPHGIGYNLTQSKIALGSGKFFGKGLFAGTQNQLQFLPEKHTDFIFSVIGEEFGFIGVGLIICIYLFLLWQIFKVASEARDNYGRLIATGIGTMLFFHILENVGMTMGLMPITGLPLPFISYGGSSMVTSLAAIGLVININLRNKKIIF